MISSQVEQYFSMPHTVATWWKPEQNRWYRKQLAQVTRNCKGRLERVADIGTGKGRWACYFAERGAEYVYALDISDEMLTFAREYAQERKVEEKISFEKGSISDVELKKDYFDAVCCMETIIHLKDPQTAVLKMAKSLKEGGILIVNTDRIVLRNKFLRNIYSLLYWVNSLPSWLCSLYDHRLFAPIRRLLGNMIPRLGRKAPYEYGMSDRFVNAHQLATTDDAIEFLTKYPKVEILFSMDALNLMSRDDFLALFKNAGLTISNIIPEGYWFFPKGDIIIAKK